MSPRENSETSLTITVRVPGIHKMRRRLAGFAFQARDAPPDVAKYIFFRAGRSYETRMRAIDKGIRVVRS